jgi:4-hydroxy-3-methylbut-2-enyl diphosphate reductase
MADIKIYQRGLGLKSQVKAPLKNDYEGQIVKFAREHGFQLKVGDLTFRLATEFGFCYGVDRAVAYAYETRARFPDRNIFITGEIIHNPYVNKRLEEMGIRFLSGSYGSDDKFKPVTAEDVVLLPAFGVSTDEMRILESKGCIQVDTTCGSVLNVWKNVERYARTGFTSIVHGKYWHEETKATVSRAEKFDGGHYLVVRDMNEAEMVCRYIESNEGGAGLVDRFSEASSPGFDPAKHLQRIGLANQTTMLSSESMAIGARLRRAMVSRYGEEDTQERFRSFDTICSATQERQDAVIELAQEGVDLMIVIGGYNSSNTSHLADISARYCETYHISDSTCLLDADEISHRRGKEEITTRDWLPPGEIRIGVTAGASTPNIKVDESIRRIVSFRGLSAEDLRPA